MKINDLLKISAIPVLLASLCCLSPIILLLAGVGTISFAASLTDTLYGEYKWLFRAIGLVALTISLFIYLRRQKNICTLNDFKRRKNEVINIILLSLIVAILGYIFFLYVVVHYIGVWLNIWQ